MADRIDKRKFPREDLVFPNPPIGIYKDAAGYLEIGKDSVTFFRNQWPLAPKMRRTILFREIFAVTYGAGVPWRSGFLCVRAWQDRHIPTVQKTTDAVLDETSVYFHKTKNQEFQRLYMFLKQCADIANAANILHRQVGKAALLGRYVGFYGYMELGPDAVMIHKKVLWAPATDRIIPYNEIAEVAFREAKAQNDGGLSIRGHMDRKDIKAALRNAITDENAIDFSAAGNEQMRSVYALLMEHASENLKYWSQFTEQ